MASNSRRQRRERERAQRQRASKTDESTQAERGIPTAAQQPLPSGPAGQSDPIELSTGERVGNRLNKGHVAQGAALTGTIGIAATFSSHPPVVADVAYFLTALLIAARFLIWPSSDVRRHPRRVVLLSLLVCLVVFTVNHFLHSLQRPPTITRVSDSSDTQGIMKKLDELIAAMPRGSKPIAALLRVKDKTQYESLPGFSVHALLNVHRGDTTRRRYLFDYGRPGGSRMSAYLAPNNTLALSVLDAMEEPYVLHVPIGGDQGFRLDQVVYLVCSVGTSDSRSILSIVADNVELGRFTVPARVDVSSLVGSSKKVGADLHGTMPSAMTLTFLLEYSRTLTAEETMQNMIELRQALAEKRPLA